MMKRTQVQAVVLMAVGALAGYAAASCQLTSTLAGPGGLAATRAPPRQRSPDRRLVMPEGTDRGLLLARADGHEARRRVMASRRRTAGSRTSS